MSVGAHRTEFVVILYTYSPGPSAPHAINYLIIILKCENYCILQLVLYIKRRPSLKMCNGQYCYSCYVLVHIGRGWWTTVSRTVRVKLLIYACSSCTGVKVHWPSSRCLWPVPDKRCVLWGEAVGPTYSQVQYTLIYSAYTHICMQLSAVYVSGSPLFCTLYTVYVGFMINT